jgi:tRNA pseudouridine-54 N-methylase
MTNTDEPKILRFIQLLPNIPPTINFSNKDLPGSGKRVDILCRVLAACFDWGPSRLSRIRIEVMALFSNERTLTFSNPREDLPIGEVGWGNEIREALRGNPPKFIKIESSGLDDVLSHLLHKNSSRIIALNEKGDLITADFLENAKAQNSFMLGDHRGFDSESQRIMRKRDIKQISLGEKSYLSSHCAAALISEFERYGN